MTERAPARGLGMEFKMGEAGGVSGKFASFNFVEDVGGR